MPRKGQTYEVRDEWRDQVRAAMLKREPRMTLEQLGDKLGVSKSVISDLLTGKHVRSTLVAEINAEFGWAEPLGDLEPDEEALLRIFRQLKDSDRAAVTREAARRIHAKVNPETALRRDAVSQTLAASVKSVVDQTTGLSSISEGSPRSPRTRRAPRGG